MRALASQSPQILVTSITRCGKTSTHLTNTMLPLLPRRNWPPSPISPKNRKALNLALYRRNTTAKAALNVGTGNYEDKQGDEDLSSSLDDSKLSNSSSKNDESPNRIPNYIPVVVVVCACTLSLVIFLVTKGSSSILQALSKSGFTAAFSLIFVSEIGDKTFFIAALLAMQYDKVLVLVGSMGALSLMSVLSVLIGRIFHSVPAQFQTTLPVGEYAAVALLMFFGIKSIKDAWDAPPALAKKNRAEGSEEFVEAEELVKEKASKRLSNPLEVVWKSFSLVFFAEWGDRSMLATIALGAAQSPWGVASGAITGHLIATSVAIIGGAFLANYISEKLVGYIGGALFLVFAIATFFGVF